MAGHDDAVGATKHLLVSPLHGAVTFEEVHNVALAVGQDLDLHVARVDDKPVAAALALSNVPIAGAESAVNQLLMEHVLTSPCP